MKTRVFAGSRKFFRNFKVCFGDAVKEAQCMTYPNDEE